MNKDRKRCKHLGVKINKKDENEGSILKEKRGKKKERKNQTQKENAKKKTQ